MKGLFIMKKILSLILVISVCLSITSLTAFAEEEEVSKTPTQIITDDFNSKFNKGDVDGDGKLSTADASEILRVAAKIQEPRENVNYDLDGDGKYTTQDARKALRVTAGLEVVVTNEEIFEYFKEELNTVKSTRPGFKRTATATCKSATITMKGSGLLDADNMEYVDYLNKHKTLFIMASSQEEFDAMLAEAKAIYVPQVQTKTVEKAASQHLTYYPIAGLATSCNLSIEDIKSIKLTLKDGYYTIVATLGTYTYNQETNPYPATSKDYKERHALPYGKVFNLPDFENTEEYSLESVKLENGKITVKINAETGEIITSDYFFQYTASMTVNAESSSKTTTKMKQVVTLDEFFEMNTAQNA